MMTFPTLPTIEEDSESVISLPAPPPSPTLHFPPPPPSPPIPFPPPPTYESLLPRRYLRNPRGSRHANRSNERRRELYFGFTLRTLLMFNAAGACLVNTVSVVLGNWLIGTGISDLILIASWILHTFIFLAAVLRNKSFVALMADVLVVLGVIASLTATLFGLLFIGSFIFMGFEGVKDNAESAKKLCAHVLLAVLFVAETGIPAQLMYKLYNELANVDAPRVFY